MKFMQRLQGGPTIMASNVQQKGIRPRRQRQRQRRRQQTLQEQQLQQQEQYKHIRTATVTITEKRNSLILLLLSLLLLLLLAPTGDVIVNAEGNVGCQFVKTLCLDGSEVCFDDNIFGKCIPTTGVDVEDIETTPLTEDQSRILATMLEEMQGAGLGWDHPFVQCRIQGALYSLQKHTLLPPNLCANLAPDPDVIDQSGGALAFVRFSPPNYSKQQYPYNAPNSAFVSHRSLRHDPSELAHFASMDYPQPAESPELVAAFLQRERQRAQLGNELESEHPESVRNQLELYQMLAASEPDPQPFQRHPAEPLAQSENEPKTFISAAREDSNEMYFPENYAASFKRSNGKGRQNEQLIEQSKLWNTQSGPRGHFRKLNDQIGKGVWKLNGNTDYGSNELEQADEPFEDDNDAAQALYEKRLRHNSLTPIEEEAILAANSYPTMPKQRQQQDAVYTEGGRFFVPEMNGQMDQEVRKEEARLLLENMLGFTRHERLDVKKPGPLVGPPYDTKHAATKATRNNTAEASRDTQAQTKEFLPESVKDNNSQAYKQKKIVKSHSDEDHAPHTVDTEYAHVFVKNPIDSWSDGVRIVNELANILHMQGYFAYLTIQSHEVSFRVDSNNPERKTATDVARIINESRGVRNNILRRLGVTVLRAGVGDKIKSDADGGVSSARMELTEQAPDMTHIMAYMFAGAGAAAVIVIFATLILIKRQDKKRDKLGGLQSGAAATESCSKDYQELCRARMASKNAAPPEPVGGGRITTLSKDNERPPSTRSSTSSWSEEPALTNMDISTGHMVLSYMEDHLRNKGRLQREWEALCRYEAEPSTSDAALQPQCAILNRAGAPLPYDHSRVVLNHLANAEGLDYINASTITDHDPRTPSYVAAQGPLPTTLAHFWQMIWEQGAVVIVALCRLQENGEIACVRYWPEEGAEVYHYYEVHLVSEHIWCDDYLVRSFYLKNLRTSETRTVTQFHFLSWPQGGVPAQPKALLDFRRKVNKSYRGRSCPIVVHGSAGAGRTGAYILLDMVLGRMNKGAREIDIAATLEHLRDQRAGVVATRQQFEFVLMAVAEEVHAILKALPANTSNDKRETELEKKEVMTLKEERHAAESEASTSHKTEAEADEAKTEK